MAIMRPVKVRVNGITPGGQIATVWADENEYERTCKEWLRGCSCANKDNPEECKECTDGFLKHIKLINELSKE